MGRSSSQLKIIIFIFCFISPFLSNADTNSSCSAYNFKDNGQGIGLVTSRGSGSSINAAEINAINRCNNKKSAAITEFNDEYFAAIAIMHTAAITCSSDPDCQPNESVGMSLSQTPCEITSCAYVQHASEYRCLASGNVGGRWAVDSKCKNKESTLLPVSSN